MFLLSCALYPCSSVCSSDFHYETFNGDAVSRMANLLTSSIPATPTWQLWDSSGTRDPRLPTSSHLIFYHFWTPLASHNFAASLVSAL